MSTTGPDLSFYKKAVKVFTRFSEENQIEAAIQDNDLLRNNQVIDILQASPGILWIANLKKEGYVFVSDSIKSIMGYTPGEFYTEGLKKTVQLFPTEQNHIILNHIYPTIFDYFAQYAKKGLVKDLRACYPSLMLCANGEYRWFYHQASVIHCDDDGVPEYMMKLLTDIHDIKKDPGMNMSIAIKDESGIYKTIFSKNFIPDGSSLLSSREVEIIYLMAQGLTSSEIAEKLFISPYTVSNHRKNMIKKMMVKNTNELIIKASASGII